MEESLFSVPSEEELFQPEADEDDGEGVFEEDDVLTDEDDDDAFDDDEGEDDDDDDFDEDDDEDDDEDEDDCAPCRGILLHALGLTLQLKSSADQDPEKGRSRKVTLTAGLEPSNVGTITLRDHNGRKLHRFEMTPKREVGLRLAAIAGAAVVGGLLFGKKKK